MVWRGKERPSWRPICPLGCTSWTSSEQAGPTLQWLEGFGIRFESLATPFITTTTSRLMPVGGGLALVEALTDAAEARSVRFAFETAARTLRLLDDGSLAGLRVRQGARNVDVDCRAVILACGGFQGNDEMMARYVERAAYVRPIARGGYYDKGEGIQMALDIGAAPAGNYSLFHAEPIDPRSGIAEPALFVFPYGILVNRHGERFTDEAPGTVDATYEAITRQILEQPDGLAYILLDEQIEDVPNYQVAVRSNQPPITAASLPALADALGLPADAVVSAVAEYNAACPSGGSFEPLRLDARSTSGLNPPKSNWARPLDTPSFRAYPITCANVFSFGGLLVNSSAQVIDREGLPIPGLYAAGEVIGLYHGHYIGSTSVLRGAVFGRQAGRHAPGRWGFSGGERAVSPCPGRSARSAP